MNVRIAECRMRCSIEAGDDQGRDSPPLQPPCLSERLVCATALRTVHCVEIGDGVELLAAGEARRDNSVIIMVM